MSEFLPPPVTDEQLIFLDDAARGGLDMHLAGPYLAKKFSLSANDAHCVLAFWLGLQAGRRARAVQTASTPQTSEEQCPHTGESDAYVGETVRLCRQCHKLFVVTTP